MAQLTFDYDASRRQVMVSGDHFDEIRERFSVVNKAARFSRWRNRFTASRKYVITPQGRFDPGLYFEIKKYIKETGHKIKTNVTDGFRSKIYPKYNIKNQLEPGLSLTLRDYQDDIVNMCLRVGRGTVVLATAGGKTLTIAALIENIYRNNNNFKCLVVVPDLGLVNQTYKDFNDYNTTFLTSKWTGNNELNLGTNIVIANLGILQSNKTDYSWIEDIDLLIVDEVHKLRRDNKINKIIKKIRTPHKFGFTGTMPEELLDQWNIIGKIGPILYERSSFDLRKEKYIADAKIQIIKIEYLDKPKSFPADRYDPSARYRRELEFTSTNSFRNEVIGKLCGKFDNNCLILIDYISHGEALYENLSNLCKNKQVYFIRGEVPVEERDKVKSIMENKTNVVCIAISKIFSTGINIKNLHYIMFTSGGKAKIKIIQSIGRGLRKHKDKQDVIIIDIADKLHYGYQHLCKRLKHYKNERIIYGIKEIKETKS